MPDGLFVDKYDNLCNVPVRSAGFHQCGPGSIPRFGVICGLNLLVLFSAPRGFLTLDLISVNR